MECPRCSNETRVADSRKFEGYVRRRRLCTCGNRFTTYEMTYIALQNERTRLTKKEVKLMLMQIINEVIRQTTT